jgi:hypothetical protein
LRKQHLRRPSMAKKTLTLPIKKYWFDKIISGKKRTEYRDIKKHYCGRLLNGKFDDTFSYDEFIEELRAPLDCGYGGHYDVLEQYGMEVADHYTHVKMINGYGNNRPWAIYKVEKITIDIGKYEWGAIPGVFYFCIHLAELVDYGNLKKESN